jgi:hypothetical protein
MAIQLKKVLWCFGTLCVLLGVAPWSHAEGQAQHEFLFFPSVASFDTLDESDADLEESEIIASADLVYSYSGDHFRLLAEYLWSTEEAELERLKAGWKLTDTTMLWFGRFHSPARYWMSAFHHGQYMQTSITRPSLEAWEDDSGSTPSHITGLLFEFDQELDNDAALDYGLSIGLAPKFVGERLEPHDLLDPRSGHGLSMNVRVGYRPEYFGSSAVGLLWSWNEIKVPPLAIPGSPDLNQIDQMTAGIFADWKWDGFRLITSVIYYNNNLRYATDEITDDFLLAYAQPEYAINDSVTLFGRIDTGIDEDNSIYLRLLPAFASHRSMAGVRWDFADAHALTLELAETSKQGDGESHVHFKEVRLQWSAVFP